MQEDIKKYLRFIVPQFVLNSLKKILWKKQLRKWRKNGCPIPPPHIVKQNEIIEYQKRYQYSTLIETGTYFGDMVEALKNKFKRIISIEIDSNLFVKAKKRFINDAHITIVQGDSGKIIPDILIGITDPVIFWLDGHYSGGVTAKGAKECPIFEELEAILNNVNLKHVILIDDARCFVGKGDYPTIKELTNFVKSKNSQYKVDVKHDIIRLEI